MKFRGTSDTGEHGKEKNTVFAPKKPVYFFDLAKGYTLHLPCLNSGSSC
jgi:hypothetical protein